MLAGKQWEVKIFQKVILFTCPACKKVYRIMQWIDICNFITEMCGIEYCPFCGVKYEEKPETGFIEFIESGPPI